MPRNLSPEPYGAHKFSLELFGACKLRPESFREREGWAAIPAVQKNYIYEIKSPLILQPGPAALTDGLNNLVQIFGFGDHGRQLKKA